MKYSRKQRNINVCVDPDVMDKIDKMKSLDFHVNISAICSRALEAWIEANEWRCAEDSRVKVEDLFNGNDESKDTIPIDRTIP